MFIFNYINQYNDPIFARLQGRLSPEKLSRKKVSPKKCRLPNCRREKLSPAKLSPFITLDPLVPTYLLQASF
jgi:hypothetical protein